VVNWHPERRGGRPIIHPVTGPANRPNLYNRPGNQNLLASRPTTLPAGRAGRPGGPATPRPGGPQAGRPAARPTTLPAGQAGRPGGPATPRPGGPQAGRPATMPAARPAAKPAQPKVRPAGGRDNVLADRNGNVYRRDQAGDWQSRQGNQWSRPGAAARPAGNAAARPATRPSPNTGQLNQDFAARQRGDMRTQNFQRSQSVSPGGRGGRPSGGGGISRPSGGGFGGGGRGGGGGRRR
jgi:hypothetical protein